MDVGVVVVAAGQGKRMGRGYNKQFIPLGDRPLLVHTLQVFERMANVAHVVLVTSEGDLARCQALCRAYNLTKVSDVVAGGETRQESTRCGLARIRAEWVLVHDGARPFVTEVVVADLIASMRTYGAAVLAVPVKDTIKKVNAAGFVESTPPREQLWAVQTPQAFCTAELQRAHEQAAALGIDVTDDAMLMERMGRDVYVVRGDYDNIKLTTPEDVYIAETILHKRRPEE